MPSLKSLFRGNKNVQEKGIHQPASGKYLDIYRPLASDRSEIRVLILRTSRLRVAPIQCSLSVVSLDDNPVYSALSYCWGDSTDTQTIKVDDKSMTVTSSLATALRHMRSDEDVLVWVDAVCINQSDLVEKSSQVPLMARIYLQARQTVAWLGPAADDSDYAFRVIRRMAKEMGRMGGLRREGFSRDENKTPLEEFGVYWLKLVPELHDEKTLQYGGNRAWRSLIDLMFRPYWNRVWVQQELILAPDIVFCCGESAVDWNTLQTAICDGLEICQDPTAAQIIPWIQEQTPAAMSLLMVQEVRRLRKSGAPIDVCFFTDSYYHLHATDPKDYIYGLLGISDGKFNVDYNISNEQVYHEYGIRNLEFLGPQRLNKPEHSFQWSGIGHHHCRIMDEDKLPSWVPHVACVSEYGHNLFNREEQDTSGCSVSLSMDRSILHVRGDLIDEVSYTTRPPDGLDDGADLLAWWLETMRDASEVADSPFGTPGLQVMFRTPLRAQWKAPPVDFASPVCQKMLADFLVLLSRHDAKYIRSTNGKDLPTVEEVLPLLGFASFEDFEAEFFGQSGSLLNEREFLQLRGTKEFGIAMVRVTANHSLFQTRHGFLGLGPQHLQKGDQLCLFEGFPISYMVRPTSRGYKLVGECFIDGLLESDAIKAQADWSILDIC